MNKQDAGRSPAVKVVSPTPAMDINRGTDTRGDVRARDAATTHGACAVVEWGTGKVSRKNTWFYPVDPGMVIFYYFFSYGQIGG
jgi:hypothetical protein